MKGFLALFALSVFLLAAARAAPSDDVKPQPKKCQEFCTMEFNPVCGYDGTCYYKYPNQCTYEVAKCSKKSNLETVDISLCDTAAKNNHPDYKLCSD